MSNLNGLVSAARLCLLAGVFAVLTAACGSPTPPRETAAQKSRDSEWSGYQKQFIEDYFKAHPFFAVDAGRHEFDGMMPDVSAQGIAAEVARLKAAREKTAGFADDTLTPAHRFEREYVLSQIDKDLFWLDAARSPFRNPRWYVTLLDPDVYLNREYAPLEKREAAFVAYEKTLPGIAQNIRENLKTPLPKSYVEYGIAGFGGFARFFRDDVPKVFASIKDPALAAAFKTANAAAIKSMSDLADWLKSQRASATDDFAIGPDLFAKMLKDTERVTASIKDIEAAGRADLDRNTASLKSACEQFLPGGTLEACVAKVMAHKAPGGALSFARSELETLRDFIVKHGIVSIPDDQTARVAQAPPYNAQNFAYIQIPGPYDRNLGATFFIAAPDPSWTKAEQAAYTPGQALVIFTSVHEVWPGHFLQFLHSNRVADPVAQLFVSYAFAEGWAHYAEEMMWEFGLGDRAPEMHIGQIVEALMRDVRLLSAIGEHTEGMTVAQSEQMFREQAFQDPGNARQQAARGTYDPAYLNYTLGKLMIRKLRTDWTESRGGRTAWKDFHDSFLSYGGPPIPLVRSAMLPGDKEPLL